MTRTGIRHEPHPDDPIRCANCEGASIGTGDCRGQWVTWRPVGGGPEQRTWVPYHTAEERP